MSLADKLLQVANNMPLVFGAGEAKSDKAWRERVYVTEVEMSDTNSIDIELPFIPDRLCLFSFDAKAMSTALTYYTLTFDRVSFSQRCAVMGTIGDNLAINTAGLNNSTRDNYFTVSENGVKFAPPQSSYWKTSLWRSGHKYKLVAIRTGKTDREMLEEEVAALPNVSSSISFSQKRVLETVTAEEWAAIIATKPNVTFAFV